MGVLLRGKLWERVAIAVVLAFLLFYTLTWRGNVFSYLDDYTDRYTQAWRNKFRHIELSDDITWSDFAYCTYATQTTHLCSSLMLLESLHRLDVKADLLLLYSNEWDATNTSTPEGRLLTQAKDLYGANIQPIEILRADRVTDTTWAMGFTKLLAFNQTQYRRVIMLDSDGTVLRSMDELFLMPPLPVAMPRAYWLDDKLSDQITLVTPSTSNFGAIQRAIEMRAESDYDMEILNQVYGDSCAVIPHRPYNLLTGEFRKDEHDEYLGNEVESWNPEVVMQEAKYVHFSDWPLPKPWVKTSSVDSAAIEPKCADASGQRQEVMCEDRRVWRWLYEDFRARRKNVCGDDDTAALSAM